MVRKAVRIEKLATIYAVAVVKSARDPIPFSNWVPLTREEAEQILGDRPWPEEGDPTLLESGAKLYVRDGDYFISGYGSGQDVTESLSKLPGPKFTRPKMMEVSKESEFDEPLETYLKYEELDEPPFIEPRPDVRRSEQRGLESRVPKPRRPKGSPRLSELFSRLQPAMQKLAEKYKDQIPGGLADKKTPKDFDPKQLAKGKKVEMEHVDDPQKALEIAMDHLTEFPNYYDALDEMEKKLESKKEKKKE